MKKSKGYLYVALVVFLFTFILTTALPVNAVADQAKQLLNVFITNSDSEPVPVKVLEGSTQVEGTVGISTEANTVNVNSVTNPVTVEGSVSVSGGTVGFDPANNTVKASQNGQWSIESINNPVSILGGKITVDNSTDIPVRINDNDPVNVEGEVTVKNSEAIPVSLNGDTTVKIDTSSGALPVDIQGSVNVGTVGIDSANNTVNIENSKANPLAVSSTNEADVIPYRKSGEVGFHENASVWSDKFYINNIPSGKRLVIEHVSAYSHGDDMEFYELRWNSTPTNALRFPPAKNDGNAFMNEDIKVYVDSGETWELRAFRWVPGSPFTSDVEKVWFQVIGYLVDK